MKPLISICIPTYNQTYFLKETIESVLNQSFDNYEVVIGDDSTNDDVLNLIQSCDFKNKLNYQHNKPALGSPKNWNDVINRAKGEYIILLHHDDWFSSKDSLNKIKESMSSKDKTAIVFCGAYVSDNNKKIVSSHIPSEKDIAKFKKNKYTLINGNIIGSPSVCLFKKTDVRFDENMKWLVDVDFYINLVKSSTEVEYLKEPLITITSGAEHQMTNLCLNKVVEIKEWFYIYKKHRGDSNFSIDNIIRLIKLFALYDVRKFSELKEIVPDIKHKMTLKLAISLALIKNKLTKLK